MNLLDQHPSETELKDMIAEIDDNNDGNEMCYRMLIRLTLCEYYRSH
jgi:Tfp pilus assembly protein PilO